MGDLSKSVKDKYAQTTMLEALIPPKAFIRKLIQVLQTESIPKRLHILTLRTIFPFMLLDINPMFSYLQPLDNQYYVEACNHHEWYIQILQKLARWHGYTKLLELKIYGEIRPEEEKSSLIVEEGEEAVAKFFEKQRELVDRNDEEEGKNTVVSETIKS